MVEPDHGADGFVLQVDEPDDAVIDTGTVELSDDSGMTVLQDAAGPHEVGIQDVSAE
ncbi:hypothetical protein MWU75_15305 [Ornithinimicrobium sp. F0845]|uniref:hypothetical protein n=1 Tax=Ornithinimicrobium sp. F0845 TaxID=2926412 RepID=UPI001FF32BC1|nr:hypothetical protein [Ornithinimicrobium sp. F0845]MCK0113514.1 hypothetical protein [Ornithinimicrobium sp. F0845]